jgi:hypothetical protein
MLFRSLCLGTVRPEGWKNASEKLAEAVWRKCEPRRPRLSRLFDYIHFNPVKHGSVALAADWPYFSFQKSINLGLYPVDWAGAGGIISNSAVEALNDE